MWSVHEIYTYVYTSVYFVCCLNVLAQYMCAVISLYMIVGCNYIYTHNIYTYFRIHILLHQTVVVCLHHSWLVCRHMHKAVKCWSHIQMFF